MMQPSGGGGSNPKFPGFKVHKLLGKGSYGKVYKVERESDKQLYALKEADLGAMSQAERADAVNEVRLLVSISHQNVIRYYEAFLLGSKLCTVMEFAPFGDLAYYIRKGSKLQSLFPEESIWRIFLQLCRGVEALHAQQVIHRDIKPANIFLCQHDLLKLGDLGVAKALTNTNLASTQIGTPFYMAPEVWAGRPYSYSSDLWSMGAVLYEMMTFRPPMEGRSMPELRQRIIMGRYAPIQPGRYSQELISLCYSLLSNDPKKRPSPTAVLASPAAAKWLRVLPRGGPTPPRRVSDSGKALLDTIIVPRDLKQLPRKLPPPQYDDAPLRQAVAAALPSASGPSSRSPSPLPSPPSSAPSSSHGFNYPVSAPGSRGHTPPRLMPGNAKPLSPSGTPGGGGGANGAGSRPSSRNGSRNPSPDVRQVHDARRPGTAMNTGGLPAFPIMALPMQPTGRCVSPSPRIANQPWQQGHAQVVYAGVLQPQPPPGTPAPGPAVLRHRVAYN